jgi:Xaa-Pro aminopeptidase
LSQSWRRAVAAASADTPDLTGSWDYISVGPDPWSGGGTIASGSLIKADVGCLIGGYSSDTARTFVCGQPDRHAARIFAVLEEAFETGFALLKPGAAFADIHAATLRVIHAAGFNGYSRGHFGHSLGADVGMEEWPFISADSDEIVEPGMVLAFETPFYGTGLGALMIEDQLLVTSSGPQSMNRLPRGLRQLPD